MLHIHLYLSSELLAGSKEFDDYAFKETLVWFG